MHIVAHVHPRPAPVATVFVVAVPDVDYNPMEHRGAWRVVSPEEQVFGVAFTLKRDVDVWKNASGTDAKKNALAVLTEWKKHMLSVTVRFEVFEKDKDCFWRNVSDREKWTTNERAVARTPRQRIEEINLVSLELQGECKHGKDPSADQIIAAYRENDADFSPHSEQLSDTFIKAAISVRKRIMVHPRIVESILAMEKKYQHNSPWRSVYNMLAVAVKASSAKAIEWVFLLVADRCLSGELQPESVTEAWLKGAHGKGSAVGFFTFRQDVRDYLMKTKAQELGIEETVREAIREKLWTVSGLRSNLRQIEGKKPELTWMKGWRASDNLWLQFVDDAVYGTSLDGPSKTAAKNNKSVEEWCNYTSVKERLLAIKEARTKEGTDEDDSLKRKREDDEEPEDGLCNTICMHVA